MKLVVTRLLPFSLQIARANVSCPPWFSTGARNLIKRILDPNPHTVSACSAHLRILLYLKLPSLEALFVSEYEKIISLHLLFLFSLLQRITISQILEDEWFKKDYKPPHSEHNEDVSLEDVDAAFDSSEVIKSECPFLFCS